MYTCVQTYNTSSVASQTCALKLALCKERGREGRRERGWGRERKRERERERERERGRERERERERGQEFTFPIGIHSLVRPFDPTI